MSELPTIPGGEVAKVFEKAGFVIARRESSHLIMNKPGHRYLLTVVVHGNKPMKAGTLRALIRKSGLTVDQFCQLMK